VIHFDIASLTSSIKELEQKVNEPNFWDNPESSTAIVTKLKRLQNKAEGYNKLVEDLANLSELNELLLEEADENLLKDVVRNTIKLEEVVSKLEVETLLSGKYDKNNSIVTLHPGAGGTESQDWAGMLYRMYSKWGASNGFEVKELDYLEGDGAGIKSVTFLVMGENSYGYLRSEMGVHRLVRISPFDSGGRRHTSFASVEVLPEIADDVELEINADDLRIDTYRASGAGGQHVNTTDSAVRITHIPTGAIASCQSERSQIKNRETAMKMLKSRLLELKEKENLERIEDLKGVQRDIAWGSQIRSYVFCPYTMVKDHRTGYEVGNVDSVMDGDLNGFMEAFLRANLDN